MEKSASQTAPGPWLQPRTRSGGGLSWLGLGLALAGLGLGFWRGWSATAIAPLLSGLGLVLLGQLLRLDWRQRAVQARRNALLSTLAVFALLVGLNISSFQAPWRFDFSEDRLNSLAPQTTTLLRELPQPITVWVFSPQLDRPTSDLLDRFRRQSPNLRLKRVDPQRQASLVRQFGARDPGDLYLEQAGRRQFLLNLNQEPLSEVRLTSALQRIGQTKPDALYLLTGHGELGPPQLSRAIATLRDRGYRVESLNLAARLSQGQGIPKDARLLVLAGPQRSLLPNEVKALQTYLKQGGSLLVLVEPSVDAGLVALLEDWGLELDRRPVIDSAAGALAAYGPTAPLVSRYGDHPISRALEGGNSFFPDAGAVIIREKPGVDATPLLITNDRSWAESQLGDTVQFDREVDLAGPLALGIAARRRLAGSVSVGQPPRPDTPEARLVLLGSSKFATDGLFNQQLNGDVLLNSIDWLSQRDQAILSIRPRQQSSRRLLLSPEQLAIAVWCAALVLPGVGFATAFGLWWKRR
jgi:ABC-type uncharacterized transport system involved in gliding motility auxiliary subunit